MTVKLLSHSDHGQVKRLKSPQQGLCRGTTSGAFGIARRQAGQGFMPIRQVLANLKLEQGQQTQGQREQANQSGGPLVTLHIHGGQRQRFAFEPSKVSLHQVRVSGHLCSTDVNWGDESLPCALRDIQSHS